MVAVPIYPYLSGIEDIEKYDSDITANYKINLILAERSYYEYDVTFDGKNKFRIDILRNGNEFQIIGFGPIPSNVAK